MRHEAISGFKEVKSSMVALKKKPEKPKFSNMTNCCIRAYEVKKIYINLSQLEKKNEIV